MCTQSHVSLVPQKQITLFSAGGLSCPSPSRRCVFYLTVRHEKLPQLLRPGNARGVKSKAPLSPQIRTPIPLSSLWVYGSPLQVPGAGSATLHMGLIGTASHTGVYVVSGTALFGDRVACQTSDLSSGPLQTCLVCSPLMEVLKEK